jgi:2-iminobutanoate/2-iminopropanoate deaminase
MPNVQYVPTPYSYSAAVRAGATIFLGLHRGFGETFSDQLEGALAGMKNTLAEFGLGLDSLMKINVWLKDVRDLPSMEKIVGNYFEKDHYPARMTATTQFIDQDCLVMIDGTAYAG